jgi:hypothetical protein
MIGRKMRDQVDPAYLRRQAERCCRLAEGISDIPTATALRLMAEDYELKATALDNCQEGGAPQQLVAPNVQAPENPAG